MKILFYVEYAGKQVEEKVVIAKVKRALGCRCNKIKDLKTLNLYVKPGRKCCLLCDK